MKKENKLLLITIVLLIVVGALFAGGAKETKKSSLLVSRWAGPHADFQKVVVKDYPTATVTIDDIDYGSLKQKQLTSFSSAKGTGNYDVVWVNIQWMKEYVDAGYLLPLDDFISSSGLDTSIYASGMFEGVQYDGKIYGLPTFAQCLMVTYDSAAMERAGLEVPKSAEELIAVAKYFKEKEGTGIAIPAKQGGGAITLFSQLLFSNGGYYFDENDKLALTSQAGLEAARIYDELAKYSLTGSTAYHHDEVAEAVRMGIAPIGTVMSGLANQNHDPQLSKIVNTVAYAPLYGNTGDASANNSFWVWAVPVNSNNPEEAFEFIKWFTSADIEKRQTLENQQISAVNSLASDPEVLKKTPFLPVVMQQLASGKIDPMKVNFAQLTDELMVGLSEIATTDIDPTLVLQRIEQKLKDVDFSR